MSTSSQPEYRSDVIETVAESLRTAGGHTHYWIRDRPMNTIQAVMDTPSITRPGGPAPTTAPGPPSIDEDDVWTAPAVGTPWCDCGSMHALDRTMLGRLAREYFGDLPERITHEQVTGFAAYVWQYISVCHFFLGCINDAATAVSGTPARDYPRSTGLAIVKHFSDNWHGCPDEGCSGDYTPLPRLTLQRSRP